MLKTLLILFCFFNVNFVFAESSNTADSTKPDVTNVSSAVSWGMVCKDQQIYDICYQYLVKQFGEKWAKYYAPYIDPKGIKRWDVSNHFPGHKYDLHVSYNFSGPGNFEELNYSYTKSNGRGRSFGRGPTFDFFLDDVNTDGCGQLKFWYGTFFIAPYEASRIISAQEAVKIANQKGYKIPSVAPKLLRSDQMQDKMQLMVPVYKADTDDGTVFINALDGTVTYEMKPPPGAS